MPGAWATAASRAGNSAIATTHSPTTRTNRFMRAPRRARRVDARSATGRASAIASVGDDRLDERRELRERFLPAEVARLERDRVGDARLRDDELGADRDLFQRDRRFHLAREARIVEAVRVAQPLGLD